MKQQHISLERAMLPITDVFHMVSGRSAPSPSTHQCSHIVEGIYKDNTAVNDIAQKPPSARTVNEQADFHWTGQEYAPLQPIYGEDPDSSTSHSTSVVHKYSGVSSQEKPDWASDAKMMKQKK